MTETNSIYSAYLRPQHQIRVGFQLPDNNVVDLNAVVLSIDGSVLHLETFGSSTEQLAQVPEGSPAIILSSENWAFCRCQGVLEATVARNFTIKLRGEPEIQQRREHFRMDVFIPILYSMPDEQQINSVEGIWKARRMMGEFIDPPKVVPFQGSFKVLNWDNGPDIEPSRINLSGGGLRVKTSEAFESGTYLNISIFLPLASIKVIDAVVSIIRSTEIRLTLDNRPAFSTAMKFVFLAERDRENIITYIFNEQRNTLRNQF
ncbi:DUF5634 family protein [Geobacter pelophilus]|uniref:DUF5634 family protein n=1 Tax=Geoanaerobacter pelophilus TaxID=60036 RepID=A0AAW4L4N9_9BACT|nr:PilZ-like domain-containing protein [Geoanaerobacter pelophilus]MBT0663938.1 DUF5634 family protein [Geoanaerobacter pelophilus]